MKRSIFIAGFPSAGKTTFLASLFHVLDEKRKHSKGYYVELPENISYINKVRGQWADVNELERTRTQTVEELLFKIKKDQTDVLELTVPDFSGEIFRGILKDRRLEKTISERIKSSDIVLFFIHPENIQGPIRIDNVIANTDAPETLEAEEDDKESVDDAFEYLEAPTQSLIVDLFQIFRKVKPTLKIAVIVSAWDVVQKTNKSPDHFVEKNLSLLSQYITTNEIGRIFGLSANGGDIQKDRDQILDMEPSDRITLYEGTKTYSGYDHLIEWLINEK